MDENLSLITTFFSSIWDLFKETTVPLLNISFASLWIGVFVVAFSITILRPILGIGAGSIRSISHGLTRFGRSIRRPERRSDVNA